MQILNYREEPPGKPTIATFSVYIPALQLQIHHMRVIRTKKGNLMISFPSKAVKDVDGKYQFYPYLEMGKERWEDFQKKCLEELKPLMKPSF